MALSLSPVAIQQFCNGLGVPYAGGFLYTYASGTLDLKATYFDPDGAVAHQNANPIVLDASGRAPMMFLLAASYKYILKDANLNLIWTSDQIPSPGLLSSTIGQGLTMFGDPTSPVVVVAYPVGTTYDTMHAGTVILPIDSGNLSGTFALRGMLRGAGGGTITAALVNLSDGQPNTAMVTIASADANGQSQTSVGITFPAAGATKNYGVKTKMDLGTGWAWGCELVKIA